MKTEHLPDSHSAFFMRLKSSFLRNRSSSKCLVSQPHL